VCGARKFINKRLIKYFNEYLYRIFYAGVCKLEGRKIDDLQCELYAVVHSIFNFAPFILIQFDFTNAHVDNYNAIAAFSRVEMCCCFCRYMFVDIV
jgi:hypothetical protein